MTKKNTEYIQLYSDIEKRKTNEIEDHVKQNKPDSDKIMFSFIHRVSIQIHIYTYGIYMYTH